MSAAARGSPRTTVVIAWLLLLPALLYVAAIVVYPLADTIWLSLTDASLKRVTTYVGLTNYFRIFDASFAGVILRTFAWTFSSVALKMIIGVLGALLLNAGVPGQAVYRLLTMPPWIVPMAIGIFMWGWMYNGQFGMISGELQNLRLVNGPVAFLAYGSTAFWATVITDVWIGVPLVTLYLLAGLQAIPRDLYEAAWTDGAGRFYRFRRITLPLLVRPLVTISTLSLVGTFNSFDIIWILTRGGPSGETTTMIIDTYKTAIGSYKYGEGAARAVMICLFLSLFCLSYLRMTRGIAASSA